jgi:hypothetical protein
MLSSTRRDWLHTKMPLHVSLDDTCLESSTSIGLLAFDEILQNVVCRFHMFSSHGWSF